MRLTWSPGLNYNGREIVYAIGIYNILNNKEYYFYLWDYINLNDWDKNLDDSVKKMMFDFFTRAYGPFKGPSEYNH